MVGLTLDYDIFLISRIYEYRRSGLSTKDSVIAGLYRTGGIITVAGAIMIMAFSSLMASSIHILRTVGLMLVVTCAVDTFVVRTMLVPALLLVAVEWNWWPGCVPPVTRRCKLDEGFAEPLAAHYPHPSGYAERIPTNDAEESKDDLDGNNLQDMELKTMDDYSTHDE